MRTFSTSGLISTNIYLLEWNGAVDLKKKKMIALVSDLSRFFPPPINKISIIGSHRAHIAKQ